MNSRSLSFLTTIIALILGCALSSGGGIARDHEIKSLPGWSPKPLPSRQYSGFVDADDIDYLKMHYWFVECEEDPENAPLLLWFNGGPGASSLYGLLVELGPFLLSDLSLSSPSYQATGVPQLMYNPSGWQKVANILAFSIPPPVGFSYCNPPGQNATGNDCGAWNDSSTAEVTYQAFHNWRKLYPQFFDNEVFLMGESYAGVYVPTIVQQILQHPKDEVNLVGFGVGDACTPPEICGSKHYGPYFEIQFLYGKAAFSNQLYEEIFTVCSTEELVDGELSDNCANSVNKVDDEVGGYWVYGYYDDCWYENDIRRQRRRQLWSKDPAERAQHRPRYHGPPIVPRIASSASTAAAASASSSSSSSSSTDVEGQGEQQQQQQQERVPSQAQQLQNAYGYTPNEVQFLGGNGYPCGGPNAQTIYLSLPEVKEALHLAPEAEFFQCDNGADFAYSETEEDVVSWYREIVAEGKLRVLVYNGDTDPAIYAYQAQNWTRNLGFPTEQTWRPWTLDGCQSMGGYVTRYVNNFDFLTIKGSGHMVPLHRPQVTLEFVTRFLRGEDYLAYNPDCTAPVNTGTGTESSSPTSAFAADADNEEVSVLRKELVQLRAKQIEEVQALEHQILAAQKKE